MALRPIAATSTWRRLTPIALRETGRLVKAAGFSSLANSASASRSTNRATRTCRLTSTCGAAAACSPTERSIGQWRAWRRDSVWREAEVFCSGSGQQRKRHLSSNVWQNNRPHPAVEQTLTRVPPELGALQQTTEITELPTGLRVATQWTDDLTVTLGVWIDAGSRYECQRTNGVAHFLEHLTTKGTARRSRESLETEIEDLGAHLNAYTSREQTVYYMKLFKEDMGHCADILADILLKSKLNRTDIERERGVILREMEEVRKSPEEVVFDNLHSAALKTSSLGFTILGPKENILSLQREDLVDYVQQNYTADRMVIVAVGDVKHKDVVDHATRLFNEVPRGSRHTRRLHQAKVAERPNFFAGQSIEHMTSLPRPSLHVALAWEAVSWTNPDSIAFMVLQTMIADSFQRARREEFLRGVIPAGNLLSDATLSNPKIERFDTFNTCYSEMGMYGFCIELSSDCEKKQALSAALALAKDHALLARTLIDEEQVDIAKSQLMRHWLASLDNNTSMADEIGRQLLVYRRRIPLEEFLKRIDAVDASTIRRIATKYLNRKKPRAIGGVRS